MTPFRLALIAMYTLVLSCLAILSGIAIPKGRAYRSLARLWAWLILRTSGVRCSANIRSRLDPSQGVLYVANHQSQLDIPALILTIPADFQFVAKSSLMHIPFFGWAMRLAGVVFIDRANRPRAISSLAHAAKRLRGGTSMLIFAEGTRSPNGHLLPFKKGGFVLALEASVPIVPVSISGGHEVLPKGSLRLKPGNINVVLGPPIDTRGYSIDSKDRLIALVRERIEAGLRGNECC